VTRLLHVQKVSGISGSEAHLLSVLPILRRRGWDARMVVLHEGESGARVFLEALAEAGVPALPLRLHRDADPVALGRLVAAIRRERPRLVHTHLVHGDVYGLPAAAAAGVRARVSSKHGFNEFRERRAFAAVDRAVGRLATRQIAISAGLARYLEEREGFSPGTFTVCHYGMRAGPEPPEAPLRPHLAAIGRLIGIKGFDVLLRAFERARAELPELTLELAGDGPLAAELAAAAPEGVTLLGRVDPVGPVLERAAAVVMPSRGEGFGMVALEAMERGRAVVASAVGGLPELVVPGETGLLVPPEDEDALAAAILELARDLPRARALGAAGRRRMLERFGEERAADEVEAVYRELLP
jgi:glycosyltransferase involved in cell wall biosynthesis